MRGRRGRGDRRDAVGHGPATSIRRTEQRRCQTFAARAEVAHDLPLLRRAAAGRGRRASDAQRHRLPRGPRPRSAPRRPLAPAHAAASICLKPLPAGVLARATSGSRAASASANIRVEWVGAGVAAAAPPATAGGADTGASSTTLPEPDQRAGGARRPRPATSPPTRCGWCARRPTPTPPHDFDPQLAAIDFSFKVECPSRLRLPAGPSLPGRCRRPRRTSTIWPRTTRSFRRLHARPHGAARAAAGSERSVADLGVTLVELLAYVGDHLSYQQDAVATEAYLDTARRASRCGATRCWSTTRCTTAATRASGCTSAGRGPTVHAAAGRHAVPTRAARGLDRVIPSALAGCATTLCCSAPIGVRAAARRDAARGAQRDRRSTPGATERCCLPRGRDARDARRPLCRTSRPATSCCSRRCSGRSTGEPGDADPSHRHVVRLTDVQAFSPDDPTAPRTDPLTDEPITEIAWAPEDALPFPLCISARHRRGARRELSSTASAWRAATWCWPITAHAARRRAARHRAGRRRCSSRRIATRRRAAARDPIAIPPRFRPRARRRAADLAGTVVSDHHRRGGATLTERVAVRPDRARPRRRCSGASTDVLPADSAARHARRGARRTGRRGATCWRARPTTRTSSSRSSDDGATRLRFGDDEQRAAARDRHGVHRDLPRRQRPRRQRRRRARSRTSSRSQPTAGSRRAQPAAGAGRHRSGGRRQRATQRAGGVPPPGARGHAGGLRRGHRAPPRRAARRGDAALDRELAHGVRHRRPRGRRADGRRLRGRTSRRYVDRYRMAGHDLEFDDPVLRVARDRAARLRRRPTHFRADVAPACSRCSATACCRTGAAASSIPTTSRFGQTVYLSPIYAAAQAGRRASRRSQVDDVPAPGHATTRTRSPTASMRLGRLEIARLDNDPELPRARRAAPRRSTAASRAAIIGRHDGLRLLRRHRGRDAGGRIDNPPGLPAIAYRVGTHARFKRVAARAAVGRGLAGARPARHARGRRLHDRAVRLALRCSPTC